MSTRERYEQAKAVYHAAGKRLAQRNTPDNVEKYERAKREYHRLGEELRRETSRK